MARPRVTVIGVLSLIAMFSGPRVSAAGSSQSVFLQATHSTNIQVPQVLAAVYDDLVASSATFRAQCARIGLARYVRVTVVPVMRNSGVNGRARTTMRRFASGALIATVEIPLPLTMAEYAELFGHEFEHILEQIDHVDLAALTLAQGAATRLFDGAYETRRAQRVGLAIANELDRAGAANLPFQAAPQPQRPTGPEARPLASMPHIGSGGR